MIWKGQGLKTLGFRKTIHAGSDSWLQLFEKQGNEGITTCVCVCSRQMGPWDIQRLGMLLSSLLSHTVTSRCSQGPTHR